MDKLRMQSTNGVQENIEKIQSLFPDCVTETIDERTGELVRKVDFEKLQQNLSDVIISGREDRYQFTWPDKKKAILLANSHCQCRTASLPRGKRGFRQHRHQLRADIQDLFPRYRNQDIVADGSRRNEIAL